MQTFYFSFCIFWILADSRNQLCFVGSHMPVSRYIYTGQASMDMDISMDIHAKSVDIWIWIWMGNFISTATLILADRTAARTMIGHWHDTVVCLSVCLSVTLCIVGKRYSLYQKCLRNWMGSCLLGTRRHNFQPPRQPWAPQCTASQTDRRQYDAKSRSYCVQRYNRLKRKSWANSFNYAFESCGSWYGWTMWSWASIRG